jgi:hypothetical protein
MKASLVKRADEPRPVPIAKRSVEEVLLERMREGDRSAFDALFERSFARVWALTAHAGVDVEAQREIISEVLTALFDVLAVGGEEGLGLDPTALALTQRALARRGVTFSRGAPRRARRVR